MRYVYVCPTCKNVYSMESAEPQQDFECPGCKVNLIYLGCSKEEWGTKTEQEKAQIKEAKLTRQNEFVASPESTILTHLKNIDKSLITIKNILEFFTILFVIGVIVTIIMVSNLN